ncbi:GNAT family N-acetyltransferase [Alkalicoccus halolimnae]|uniref:GNAT family N-acetyltransferase n=1 Tax=Alkalicoccus halolimnae TaxID=1667239 RepID=A0A5C7FCM2_9BACI|nr:GNAT family N-acetyltransferase [Alkalicoccus halolimnae]TXF82519.1 GNAT family N-acetyltransferase [Alkalicoccus halolimnae]
MYCRRAVKEDIQDIRDIAVQSWHDTYEGIIPREVQDTYLDKAYSKERLEESIDKANMFVCEKAGHTIGFASYFYDSPFTAEVSAIYVLPGAQREGVGSALMRHLWSHMQNVKELYIDVESGNEKAENFYLMSGFELETEFEEVFEGHRLRTKRLCMKAENEKLHRV